MSELDDLIASQRSEMRRKNIVYPEFPRMLRLDWESDDGMRLGDMLADDGEMVGLYPEPKKDCPIHGAREMSPSRWGRCRACDRERCKLRPSRAKGLRRVCPHGSTDHGPDGRCRTCIRERYHKRKAER